MYSFYDLVKANQISTYEQVWEKTDLARARKINAAISLIFQSVVFYALLCVKYASIWEIPKMSRVFRANNREELIKQNHVLRNVMLTLMLTN